jgi:hypothetical protein
LTGAIFMTNPDNNAAVEESLYVVAGANISDLTAGPNYRGQVEILRDGAISGWCFSTVDPLKPVRLELWIGGSKLSSFVTSGARGDIEKSVGLPVRPEFHVALARPATLTAADILAVIEAARKAGGTARDLVSVRVSEQPVELEFDRGLEVDFDELAAWLAKPIVIPGNLEDMKEGSALRGRVDGQAKGVINGWCVNAAQPNEKLQLEVYYKGVLMGVASTGKRRDDISRLLDAPAAAGFRFGPEDLGTSHLSELLSAFSASSPSAEGKGRARDFAVKIAGADCFLGFAPDFSVSDDDLTRYYDAAAAKLAETAKNRKIDLSHAMMAAQKKARPRATAPAAPPAEDVSVVAFYLPQFHPFPENDEWWGAGFTEWTNVASARPSFPGHNQPRVPADLGYYDLRLDLVHEKQIELARQYKISGFCYYYYSFAGKTLMTMPADRHLEKNYELDFCLCWANENWSRRWDGSESDILMRQSHSELDDNNFIDQVMKYFESPRYIKINGAPFLMVYRVSLLKNPAATIRSWKAKAKAAGFPDLHVSICETFGLSDPASFGADSACQFPPHGVNAKEIQGKVADLDKDFTGKIYDYVEVAAGEAWRPDPAFLRFRTAMPGWDNTSRMGKAAHVFHNASPAVFEAWLSVLCAKAKRSLPPGQRMVFVNAWNEWAEGAYLEPDRRDGQRNLKAVRAAQSAANLLLGDVLAAEPQTGGANAELVRLVSSLASANRQLMEFAVDYCAGPSAGPSPFVLAPKGVLRQDVAEDGVCNIEAINGKPAVASEFTVDHFRKATIVGWVRAPDIDLTATLPVFLQLVGDSGQEYVASLLEPFPRPDVSSYYQDEGEQHYGFNAAVDFQGVQPGVYRMRVLLGSVHHPNAAHAVPTRLTFIVG